jgi:hypothetical protein
VDDGGLRCSDFGGVSVCVALCGGGRGATKFFPARVFQMILVSLRCFLSISVPWWGSVSVAGVSVKALTV